MFGLFSRWRRPRLLRTHLDQPVEGHKISHPQLEVRGWLVFDKPFDTASLSICLAIGEEQKPLVLEQRAEVESGMPESFVVGFSGLFEFSEILKMEASLSVAIRYPGGSSVKQLMSEFEDDVEKKSSYYIARFDAPDAEKIDAAWPGVRETWQNEGYAIIRGFYSDEDINHACGLIESCWQSRDTLDPRATIDEYIGSTRERRLAFREAAPDIRDQPYKLNDLYLVSQPMREILLDDRLSELLATLLSGTPMICNSLYFERGSQQQDHFDTFFMPPLMRDRMLATWIALEDVSPDAGPLKYYPGSHRIEPYRFRNGRFNLNMEEKDNCYAYVETELARRGLEPMSFCPERGDLFIWHAQLFHGGEQINRPELTRRSLVTNYFCVEDWAREDSIEFSPGCYYLSL